MKHTLHWLSTNWLKLTGYLIVSIVLVALTTLRLGSLVFTQGQASQTHVTNTVSIDKIIDNPLYAPHKLTQLVVQKVFEPTRKYMQLVSVAFGLFTIAAFYIFLRGWRTERIAVLGTILLASSSWFLHLTRRSTPLISTSFFVLALAVWMFHVVRAKGHANLLLITGAILIVLGLYQPGVIWFLLVFCIWRAPKLVKLFRSGSWLAVTLASGIILIGLAILGYAFVRDYHLVMQWLLLPEQLPELSSIPKNILAVPLSLFWHSNPDPTYGLSNLPFLDTFSFVMFVLGLYQCYRRLSLRGQIGASTAFVAAILVLSLNDRATYMMIALPFVYLSIAAGITTLLQQWFTVFPRNPLARNVGIAFLAIAIGITSYYHLTRYYVAWPNAPETRAAFTTEQR